ncbi:hypothetical protein FACS1894111_12070 [Clostridia bacterium]|nr:hypothetical protein FACS1894111_12070 [Clostridia bacterium]
MLLDFNNRKDRYHNMGLGYLKLETRLGDSLLPIGGVTVRIYDESGRAIYQGVTDESGNLGKIPLPAPDKALSLQPGYVPYSTYTLEFFREGFAPLLIDGEQVFDGITTIQQAELSPVATTSDRNRAFPNKPDETEEVIDIPPNALLQNVPWAQVGLTNEGGYQSPAAPGRPAASRILPNVLIPEYITVHLGTPTSNAPNVRVRFTDYIKNTASHEIYATWPDAALEANIQAIINFTLNRIYTEWYRSKGYNFDITNSTSVDQFYVNGGNIFENISQITDRIFNRYVIREGEKNPYFTQFCNGTTSTCPGLSQWGTVSLAERGYDPLQILRYYYPKDIRYTTTDNIGGITESFPGGNLSQGASSTAVRTMQNYLNRIRVNYPLIPPITNPNGSYGADTANAVKTFQGIFDLPQTGVIDRDTWYKISAIYVGITKLAELDSEGEREEITNTPPSVVLKSGSRGREVLLLQYILDYLSDFYPSIEAPIQDNNFAATTKAAVTEFQQLFALTPDGIVGPATWNKLYEVYRSLQGEVAPPNPTPPPSPSTPPPYPEVLLRYGLRGDSVRVLQEYLNRAAAKNPALPTLLVDGIFGSATQNAVMSFQRAYGLGVDGIVGPLTWNQLMAV